MLEEKRALEVLRGKRILEDKGLQPHLIDARSQSDGSVHIYLDSEDTPSYHLDIVVTDLKGDDKKG